MKLVSTLALTLMILTMQTSSQTTAEIAEIWDKQHVTNKFPSNVRHQDLKKYLEDLKKLEDTWPEDRPAIAPPPAGPPGAGSANPSPRL